MDTCPVHIRERAYRYNEFIRPKDVSHVAQLLRPNVHSNQHAIFQTLRYVFTNIRFVRDWEKYYQPDLWQFPLETLRDGTGDCEDMCFLLASVLIELGVHDVRVTLGTWREEGHAWIEVSDGNWWYLLECTNGKMHYLQERETLGYNVELYVHPWGCTVPKNVKTYDISDMIIFAVIILVGVVVAAVVIFANQ